MATLSCRLSVLTRRLSRLSTSANPIVASVQTPTGCCFFSEQPAASSTTTDQQPLQLPLTTNQDDGGRQFTEFTFPPFVQKLKPYIVHRRLSRMQTYLGTEKSIRVSPWKLNLVCRLVKRLPVPEALEQLEYCHKKTAPLLHKVIRRTANLADIRHGIQYSGLEIAECFATKGRPIKRIKIHAKGKFGRMQSPKAHIRLILRQIDFPLRIYQAPSLNKKKKWFLLQQQHAADYEKRAKDREDVRRMEEREAEIVAKQKAEAKEKK